MELNKSDIKDNDANEKELSTNTIISSVETSVSFKNKLKSLIIPTLIILLVGAIAIALIFIIRTAN